MDKTRTMDMQVGALLITKVTELTKAQGLNYVTSIAYAKDKKTGETIIVVNFEAGDDVCIPLTETTTADSILAVIKERQAKNFSVEKLLELCFPNIPVDVTAAMLGNAANMFAEYLKEQYMPEDIKKGGGRNE